MDNSQKKKDYYKSLKIKDNEFEIKKIINYLKTKKQIIPLVVDDFFTNCKGNLKYFYNYKKIITILNPIGILYENLSRNRVDKQNQVIHGKQFFIIKKERKKSLGLLNLKK